MPFRSKTYVTYHHDLAQEIKSDDVRYVRQLLDWKIRDEDHITFVNAIEKFALLNDETKQLELVRGIKERLANSTNLLLIMETTVKEETPWVRFEVEWAVDHCKIPIIAAYKGYDNILSPGNLEHHWPNALDLRIRNASAQVVHVPFLKDPLMRAVGQFDHNNPPKGSLHSYSKGAYERWKLA